MKDTTVNKSARQALADPPSGAEALSETGRQPEDIFADLEATLAEVAQTNPRIDAEEPEPSKATADLRALLEVSLAVNSSLVLDDVLQVVMHKAIELMQAERGFIMLLDDSGSLNVRTAYNLDKEELSEEKSPRNSRIRNCRKKSGTARSHLRRSRHLRVFPDTYRRGPMCTWRAIS